MLSAHQITLWSRVSRSHQSWRRSGRHLSKNDWHHPGDGKVRDKEKREKETGHYMIILYSTITDSPDFI